jgi:hypothetical protein
MKKLIPALIAIPPISFLVMMKWNTALYVFLDAVPVLITFPIAGGMFILWLLLIFFKHLSKIF